MATVLHASAVILHLCKLVCLFLAIRLSVLERYLPETLNQQVGRSTSPPDWRNNQSKHLHVLPQFFMTPLRKFLSTGEVEKVFVNIPVSIIVGHVHFRTCVYMCMFVCS